MSKQPLAFCGKVRYFIISTLCSHYFHTKEGPFKHFVSNQPPTSPPITLLWPHVRSLPASRIILLERVAALFPAPHRQGVFAGLSANQCEHAIIQMSLSVGGGCGEPMSIHQMFLHELLFQPYIDWKLLGVGRPTFAFRLIRVIMIWPCSFK